VLVADAVYIFVLVTGFVNPLDVENPVTAMSTTIFVVQAEMEPLIDVTPYIAMVDMYLEMADPYFVNYFYDFFVSFSLVFGLIIPAIVTSGQLFAFTFFF
jgi:hypothetical protein